jgi:DNA helicase-2/ATP-dependent DNA helicase PcrA
MNVLDQIYAKTTGPCMVVAGAGTGKTYTIVEKIVHLVRSKVYTPGEILALTFSNEAAATLATRVSTALGQTGVTIKTFHALGGDLLRNQGSSLGIPSDFRIITPDDAKLLLHKSLRLAPGLCHTYVHTFSLARDKGITREALERHLAQRLQGKTIEVITKAHTELRFTLQTLTPGADKSLKKSLSEEVENFEEILALHRFLCAWGAYEKLKKKHKALDYTDLQDSFLALLKSKPSCAIWKYVIIDEFQDTNAIQLELVRLLAPHRNVMVVGDMNQSIYRFRGAQGDVFQHFGVLFEVKPDDRFALDASFRSPNTVLRAAHRVIQHNYARPEDCLLVMHAQGTEGKPVAVYGLSSGIAEARKVVTLVQEELEKGRKPEEICLITRTHQQSMLFRRAFDESGIGYATASTSNILQHPAVKSVLDYLTLALLMRSGEKGGAQAWWDVMYQCGFSRVDLVILAKTLKEQGKEGLLSRPFLELLPTVSLSQEGLLRVKGIKERILQIVPLLDTPLPTLLPQLYQVCGLVFEGMHHEAEVVSILATFLEQGTTYTSMYGPDVQGFVHHMSLLPLLGISIPGPGVKGRGVQIMTGHATKGLEYPVVIVACLAEKRFPLERLHTHSLLPSHVLPDYQHYASLSPTERDEAIEQDERVHLLRDERHLFYVACTRAKERLILTYAHSYNECVTEPSVFLREMDYLTHPEMKYVEDLAPALPFPLPEKPLTFASLASLEEAPSLPVQPSSRIVFSPSALLKFVECQKAYEYKYVLHMPDPKTISWEAMHLGSFVHEVMEEGVRKVYSSFAAFEAYALHLHTQETWSDVPLDQALHLLGVFYERNKGLYSSASLMEQELPLMLGGFSFIGFADRIDVTPDGLSIIDYKTGKSAVAPRHRNWQLGYYALAAAQLGKGPVKRVTLDMLQHEKPLSFTIDEKGTAKAMYGTTSFRVPEVAQELIATAQAIIDAYRTGFQPCPLEKGCAFCNEYMYGI